MEHFDQHISHQFNQELENLRKCSHLSMGTFAGLVVGMAIVASAEKLNHWPCCSVWDKHKRRLRH